LFRIISRITGFLIFANIANREAPNRQLAGLSFVVSLAKYDSGSKPADIKNIIKRMGGSIEGSVSETTAAVVTTKGNKTRRNDFDGVCIFGTF